jgi:DnaJ-class molecular chaperone
MEKKRNVKCNWCKGKGYQRMRDYGKRTCLNCHGTGCGTDGGSATKLKEEVD